MASQIERESPPGVLEAIEVYEATETIYVAASLASAMYPATQSVASANLPPRRNR
jgi:hypothetical protein